MSQAVQLSSFKVHRIPQQGLKKVHNKFYLMILSSSWPLVDVCDGPLRSGIMLFLLFVLVIPRILAFFTYGFHALWAPQARQISQLFLLLILDTLILLPVTHFAVVAPFSQFNPLVRALFHLECLATLVVSKRHLPILTAMVNAACDVVDAI